MSGIKFFKNTKISDNSYLIEASFSDTFPMHVYCYLIVGSEYALLIDTMLGVGNLKAYCESLTDKPIKLVNTHAHGDHIGGNYHFDECYMPYRDIPYFLTAPSFTKEMMAVQAKAYVDEDTAKLIDPDDGNFASSKIMKVLPVKDGDIFDLGDRKIEVVEVGGHTPGSIVLIDDKTRIAYSGDVCNSNTLLEFKASLSVATYLKNLQRLKTYQSRFDKMYGGHEIFDSSIIDEGIETCKKVIEGKDSKIPCKGMLGYDIFYAEERNEDGSRKDDGKKFNMSYRQENITGEDDGRQIIGLNIPELS